MPSRLSRTCFMEHLNWSSTKLIVIPQRQNINIMTKTSSNFIIHVTLPINPTLTVYYLKKCQSTALALIISVT